MSKSRRIFLLFALVIMFLAVPISEPSQENGSAAICAESQRKPIDFCCLAGLACCVMSPKS